MEVKFEKKGISNSTIDVYVDDSFWKRVKASYFERKLPRLAKEDDFKEKFLKLERKKCLDIAVYLLSKRSYLKKEWEEKMQDKHFPKHLVEEVYSTYLTPYFDEKEEVMRRISGYLNAGKGVRWIKQKMLPHISLSSNEFATLLREILPSDQVIEKIPVTI
ncbi:hypothetical protein K0U07_03510 [bacterium]|nr:hypothetical protein [bacterium]